MIGHFLAIGLGLLAAPTSPSLEIGATAWATQAQTDGSQTAGPVADPDAVMLDDVLVEGRRLEDAARNFVNEVGAPAGPRGLARWNRRVCVGVVNLRGEAARYLVDRVSSLAAELDVPVGEPGCRPNVLIVATSDGAALATAMVEDRVREYNVGSTQMAQGDRALEAFKTSNRAVRWWQVSLPVDSETGQRAIRLAGDDEPPRINVSSASRLRSQIRDDMTRAVIVIDVNKLGDTTFPQLADYVAMVAMAQIDPDARLEGYDTVLNMFTDANAASGLTAWDRTYLRALYTAEPNRINPRAQAGAIASIVTRARREANAANDE